MNPMAKARRNERHKLAALLKEKSAVKVPQHFIKARAFSLIQDAGKRFEKLMQNNAIMSEKGLNE